MLLLFLREDRAGRRSPARPTEKAYNRRHRKHIMSCQHAFSKQAASRPASQPAARPAPSQPPPTPGDQALPPRRHRTRALLGSERRGRGLRRGPSGVGGIVGAIASSIDFGDVMFAKFNLLGRLWAQLIALFGEGLRLFAFSNVDNKKPWYVALIVLIFFSLFVQMVEGTSYGIFLHEPASAGLHLCPCGCRRQPVGCHRAVVLLQARLAPIDTLLPFT